ncbi:MULTISPECIES: ShlB/FhaC/HecB family hemolysin secretion/activation protein [unclassified Pseudomonas]|uniref:ShlB/FhaC/HecB family hemolysin secretion/activation protein n=1 Tax=unclassified Pseudomonas TaxID=196821 RepID=UPI000488CBCE|nr:MULTISPECIES: ShlB/FhaC/HecB family hemolysin secretion/activation protein [unclassified Pseudomonas]RAS32924.1 hemolysin activation/secretion protein [Pseudomonas sp. URMO17WK12:I7]SME97194.1 hemolysin activation/secretion protein [Pseudomonas sp. URMO17WK12:I5]
MPCRFRHIASRLLARCLSGLLVTCTALADDPASLHLRDQQQSLRQLEQQQRLKRWQLPTSPESREQAPTLTANSQCWAVSGLRIIGNRQLADQALEPALRERVLPCMGIDDINRLLRGITQLYVCAGFPTSRPYLRQPPRDDAPLDIVIVEGFVESIELAGPALPLSLSSAFPGVLGHPLYLPDLEQGLDQLNRLRAYELGMDLLPGELQGGTRVVVQPQRAGSRWHLDSRLDNRGSELTGRHRLNLSLGLDSPLRLNDDLRVSLLSNVFRAPGQTQGITLYYSVPYGPWTFALNASQLAYDAPLPHSRQTSEGSSSYQGLSVERVLWRNQQGLLSASTRLDRKQLINRSAGAVVTQQSPTLTSLEAGINLLWLEGGLWNGYVGIAQGLDWFGADESPLGVERLRPDYRKYRASLLHLRHGPANAPWRWQSELALQYSSDALPAVEQLLVSDDSTVRGFRLRTYSAASGAAWRNTFSQPLPTKWAQPLQIRPYFGLDVGWARPAAGKPSQRLAGAAAGIELSLPDTRLRLDYQRALYTSDLPRSGLEPGFWVLECTLSL